MKLMSVRQKRHISALIKIQAGKKQAQKPAE
jgi:hypothetical protein